MLRVTLTALLSLFAASGCSDSLATADATDATRALKCEAIVAHETAHNSRFAEAADHLRETIHENLVNTCRQSGDIVVDRLYQRHNLG